MNTVIRKNKTEDTMTYYYNRPRDIFVTKMEFLELNGDVDMVVVDKTMTAQDIDVVFNDIYGVRCVYA
jgi:hypothetical protein